MAPISNRKPKITKNSIATSPLIVAQIGSKVLKIIDFLECLYLFGISNRIVIGISVDLAELKNITITINQNTTVFDTSGGGCEISCLCINTGFIEFIR